tara:strand:- start:29 stop:256 length:228 start_codon:yes stop_codon:yes gene_type:complete
MAQDEITPWWANMGLVFSEIWAILRDLREREKGWPDHKPPQIKTKKGLDFFGLKPFIDGLLVESDTTVPSIFPLA